MPFQPEPIWMRAPRVLLPLPGYSQSFPVVASMPTMSCLRSPVKSPAVRLTRPASAGGVGQVVR
ncbi:hypothetical protein EES37_35040 [Streptomyces sp. ADI91-18]|nr:hypothetical protein EES37_35040 [Streptomyces sp. ADI91-18]